MSSVFSLQRDVFSGLIYFFLQIEIKRKNQRENHIYYSQSKLSKSIRKAEGLEQTLPL
jgi:hypothetical protein|nr:MAG TPA: hypothetical protein [Caudoviricetes sp.]